MTANRVIPYIASIVTPLVVFVSLWLPEVDHYYVVTDVVDDAAVERMRSFPSDDVLDEIGSSAIGQDGVVGDTEIVPMAADVLRGSLKWGGREISVNLPFDEADLAKGDPSFQLRFASLVVPKVLLGAYAYTDNQALFESAKDYVLAFSEFERDTWLPKGFLWDEHAVAARVGVLARFWKYYRQHPSFQMEEAQRVLQAVARSARILARDDHFIYSTNHGIMQNLALWQICIAFPELPYREIYQRIASTRMAQQMRFFVSEHGVILEHSAGYQEFGIELLGLAFRYMSLLNETIPKEWLDKYENALAYYRHLRRPDGSLPMYGDTTGKLAVAGYKNSNTRTIEVSHSDQVSIPSTGPSMAAPTDMFLLRQAEGYAVLWHGLESWPSMERLRQTVVAWSDFVNGSHKHADEMSVLFWAQGQTWWTNVGYWRYGDRYRAKAVSWSGSNAPHIVNESPDEERNSRLLYFSHDDSAQVVDLERLRADGYAARRQMIQLDNVTLVVDYAKDSQQRPTEVLWTTYPDVVAEAVARDLFLLKGVHSEKAMTTAFLGGNNVEVAKYRGSVDPFAGWVAINQQPYPAQAFRIVMPAGSWSVVTWRLGENRFVARPKMVEWQGPEHWRLVIPMSDGERSIQRDGQTVVLDDNTAVRLQVAADVAQGVRALENAYVEGNRYPEYRELYPYRLKVTLLLVSLFLAQEFLLRLVRWFRPALWGSLRWTAAVSWAGIGLVLPFYFAN